MSSSNYDTFALTYGSITLLGGIIGYLKAGSYASLISSTLFGGAIFFATTQLPSREAARVLFTVGALLTAFFGIRFSRNLRIVPGGLMTGLSAYAVFKYGSEMGLF